MSPTSAWCNGPQNYLFGKIGKINNNIMKLGCPIYSNQLGKIRLSKLKLREHTYSQTDIADRRLNWPQGQFSEREKQDGVGLLITDHPPTSSNNL